MTGLFAALTLVAKRVLVGRYADWRNRNFNAVYKRLLMQVNCTRWDHLTLFESIFNNGLFDRDSSLLQSSCKVFLLLLMKVLDKLLLRLLEVILNNLWLQLIICSFYLRHLLCQLVNFSYWLSLNFMFRPISNILITRRLMNFLCYFGGNRRIDIKFRNQGIKGFNKYIFGFLPLCSGQL